MKKTLFSIFCAFAATVCSMDVKYYPGAPGDEKKFTQDQILKASAWMAPPKGMTVSSDIDGLLISNTDMHRFGFDFNASGRIPVKPGKLLKVTTKFFVLKSMPGSNATFYVRLLDANGKQTAIKETAVGTDTPPEHMVWNEEYITIPNGTVAAQPVVQFAGNPMTLRVAVLECTTVSEKDPQPYKEPAKIFSRKYLSDKELDAALAKRKKSAFTLKRNGDQVEFLVDGSPVPLKLYKYPTATFNNGVPDFARKTPDLVKAGFNMFTVNVYLGVPGHFRTASTVWLDKGKYQIDVIRQSMRRILKYAPDAYIMLEMNVTPHPGWAEANPDEIVEHSDGRKLAFSGTRGRVLTNTPPANYKPKKDEPWTTLFWIPSYYSQKFTDDASKALADIFAELEKYPESNALAGVFFQRGTDGQWFCIFPEGIVESMADYSPVSLRQFREFIRAKYNNDESALKAAWNDPNASFNTAAIPSYKDFFTAPDGVLRKVGRDRLGDFIESRGAGMSKQYIAVCAAVKKGTKGRILAGGYSAEGAITSWPFLVQQCGRYMHEAPEVDFLASCPGGRTPQNPVEPSIANGSMRLHNKLGVTELDFRSPTVWHWGMWGESIWYKTHDIKEFGQRTMRAALWANAFGGSSYAYDMDGNWYDAPSMLAAWKKNNAIIDKRKPRPLGTDRAALFYTDHFWEHMALDGNRSIAHIAKLNPRSAFTRSGIDADLYLLDDVFHKNFEAPKILCFVEAFNMTPETAAKIRKKYANSGRVIIWMWAPGIGISKDIGKVAGFKLKREQKADGLPIVALKNTGDSLMDGVSGIQIPVYLPYPMAPVWRVDDPKATILGTYLGTDIPAMAVKRYDTHTEIFVGQVGNLSPQFLRNVAKEAGAHVWCETNDPVAQAGNMIFVSAASSGKKKIRLKPGMKVISVPTKQDYTVKDGIVKAELEYGEVMAIEVE